MKQYSDLPFRTRSYIRLRWMICPFDHIEKDIPTKGVIVDIGCGFGIFAHYLAATSSERKVTGIDLVEHRIEQARKLGIGLTNVDFVCADILDHRLPQTDAITAIDVLHHIPTKELQTKLLRDCYNILQKNGKIIIKDVDKKPLWKYWWNWLHDYIMTKGEPVKYQDRKTVRNMLENVGFEFEKSETIKGYPYAHIIYIARKPDSK